jgi:PAS domain S-box-containing protein
MTATPVIPERPPRILIVDDERHNRQLMEIMLTQEGFHLLTAASGEEALAMVAEEPPDLILLDIMMPGMDGYEVAGRIKGNLATKDIPVIMITALGDRNARMHGLEAGAEDFLTKPVDRAELCVRVRNLLRLKSYGDYHDKYSQLLEGEVSARTADLVERTRTLEQQAAVLTEQVALLDLAQDAIVVRDMANRILFWSRGAEVMYGWHTQEALGQVMDELLQIQFGEPRAQIDAALLRQNCWEGEATHCRHDGTRLSVASRWALQRSIDGEPIRILTINNDITGRKHADARLALLADRLALATVVAQVGVSERDLASDTMTWDATMFTLYGIPPITPMPYARWVAAVHPDDLPAVEEAARLAIAAKGQGSSEFRITLPGGEVRTVSEVVRAVLDEHGMPVRLIGVNMDVTGRKEAARAAEQVSQDQIRFKDAFLSHVSHELRSPLTAIKQFTTILLGGLAGDLNPEQRDYQRIVLKNVRQLQAMIDDLLEVTRLETGKLTVEPERISTADAVTDALQTLQHTATAKGVSLSADLPAHLPAGYADQTRLRQILIILLDNAIKFTAAGGAVRVQARLLPGSPYLLFEVSDTGCGIGPDRIERLFERLYQVSQPAMESRKGLGLGLYICKELVARQDGQIWVRSEPQVGSTFSFTLPVFSLKNVIAPLLRDDKWPSESVALIVVEGSMAQAWPSRESQEEWSQEARALVQRCLLPNLDVLLPKMSSGAEGDRLFVAAFADEQGAAVLAGRIREQFSRIASVKRKGLTLSVYYTMLSAFPGDVGGSMENLVTSMAATLEQSINAQSHLGGDPS